MTRLVDAADAAWPPPYEDLPAAVSVVLGYVGESGCTPHIWSTREVTACRAAGYTWAPIVVPPQRALTGPDGEHAAATMAAALPQYGHRAGWPVFLDIERGSFDADPAGAAAAVRAWRAGMAAAGWPDAYVYWPGKGPFTWRPDWTGRRPKRLPRGVSGVQYAGNADHGTVDLSVFAANVFPTLSPSPREGTVELSTASQRWLVDQLTQLQSNIDAHLNAIHGGTGGKWSYETNLISLYRLIAAMKPTGPTTTISPGEIADLADALAAKLTPDLAGDLAAALAARLAT